MSDASAEIQVSLDELRDQVAAALGVVKNARLRTAGLVGYEGLRERLAIDGKLPCLRTVKALVRKHRAVLRPIELGHRLVGFHPARIEPFLTALEEKRNGKAERAGGRRL